ncbi:immunity 22 family protein [Longispora sp. NPDC051575]|uniref:immunity 22 family protein n=1 Tax=Longispora sp. NPDC051575 TaxID=3154943 RepID=UPI0034438F86
MNDGVVHVFLALGQFPSEAELRAYLDERWSPDGDAEPSTFMAQAGIVELTPECVEAVHIDDLGHPGPVAPAELLREASYADQWLADLDTAELADAAICVYPPNVVTNPGGTPLRYVGAFPVRT